MSSRDIDNAYTDWMATGASSAGPTALVRRGDCDHRKPRSIEEFFEEGPDLRRVPALIKEGRPRSAGE